MTIDYQPRRRTGRRGAIAHLCVGGLAVGIALLLSPLYLQQWQILLPIGILFCCGCLNVGVGIVKLRGRNTECGRPSGLILWGGILLDLSFVLFFGVVFMTSIGGSWWGPLPRWAFVPMMCAEMASVPAALVGVILTLVGVILRARVKWNRVASDVGQ